MTSGPANDSSDSCLSEGQVMTLLRGQLDEAAFAPIETHLDLCRLCRLLVSTLAARTVDERPREGGQLTAFVPGDIVADRYRVTKLIGVGGMGEVYEVLDTVLGETVALKTVAVGHLLGEWAPSRLKSEVQFARRVTHRNVCRVFDVGFHTETATGTSNEGKSVSLPFFTMELLRGETLREHIHRTGPVPVGPALALMEQMASGLDAAHEAGVVHRDLKSDNVMLVPAGDDTRVVITDFGLARPAPEWVSRQGASAPAGAGRQSGNQRTVAGTFGYMAPEQLSGDATGPATDLYAMGVVAFELITGELPFTMSQLMRADNGVLRGLAPELPAREGVPAQWDSAIRRCLRAAPAERFQRAGELVNALRSYTPASERRRRSGVVVAAALAAVCLVLIVQAVVSRGGGVPERVGGAGSAGPTPHGATSVAVGAHRHESGAAVPPSPLVTLTTPQSNGGHPTSPPSGQGGPSQPSEPGRQGGLQRASRRRAPVTEGWKKISAAPLDRSPAPGLAKPMPASVAPAADDVATGVDDLVYPFSAR